MGLSPGRSRRRSPQPSVASEVKTCTAFEVHNSGASLSHQQEEEVIRFQVREEMPWDPDVPLSESLKRYFVEDEGRERELGVKHER